MALRTFDLALLCWIYEQVDGQTTVIVDAAPWCGEMGQGEDVLRLALEQLEAEHCIDRDDSMAELECSMTVTGLGTVSEVIKRRTDAAARSNFTRTALVRWLYRYYLKGHTPVTTELFCQTRLAFYAGTPLSLGEVERAARYLMDKGLIVALDEFGPPLRNPELTSRGIDCAEKDLTVSEFLAAEDRSTGPTFHVHMTDAQGVIIGTQTGFTQNNTAGLDVAQLTHFAGLARQSLPALALGGEAEAAAADQAEALHAEATSGAPDRGRLRRLVDSLLASLAPAAGTALGQVVLEAGHQAVAALQ
ncbi:hypothetical protein ABZ904_48055 [Streptomyces sp. NPDC046900]|uniref:hypothetical protein n=1 Tax=Streptomyces sp. NPDC046900 TaxID=3155473 RepID=UPI0034082CDD